MRLQRTREHRQLKQGTLGYEDEKFSYLVVTRPEVTLEPPRARVLARPQESKFDVRLKLCELDGNAREINVLKRDSAAFRQVRKARWGDAL